MKQTTIIGVVLAIIAAIIGFFLLTTSKPDSNVPQVPIAQQKADACALFTESDARSLLGNDVTEKTDTPSDGKMGQVEVSHCVYTSSQGSASILVRKSPSPSDAKYIFESSKKSFKGEVQNATIGEAEYWVSSLGQYNVLKGDKWIIVSAAKDKAKAKTAAAIVASRL